jgi:hypothetical protein
MLEFERRLLKAEQAIESARLLQERMPGDGDGPLHLAHVAAFQASMALVRYLDFTEARPAGTAVVDAAAAFVSSVPDLVSEQPSP